jgi:hypothetical protein
MNQEKNGYKIYNALFYQLKRQKDIDQKLNYAFSTFAKTPLY